MNQTRPPSFLLRIGLVLVFSLFSPLINPLSLMTRGWLLLFFRRTSILRIPSFSQNSSHSKYVERCSSLSRWIEEKTWGFLLSSPFYLERGKTHTHSDETERERDALITHQDRVDEFQNERFNPFERERERFDADDDAIYPLLCLSSLFFFLLVCVVKDSKMRGRMFLRRSPRWILESSNVCLFSRLRIPFIFLFIRWNPSYLNDSFLFFSLFPCFSNRLTVQTRVELFFPWL